MRSALSYFRAYFDPKGAAPLINHSAGQIAQQCYECLRQLGEVQYLDSADRPTGIEADFFVGHFWNFLDFCKHNSFKVKTALYSVSDPARTARLLDSLAKQFGVPTPFWDLPPTSFDHQATMETADLLFVVGNTYTLRTFPARWHNKIRLLNYSVDEEFYGREIDVTRRNDFCYLATYCGLRKGFMDILRTWSGIDIASSRLHAIGQLNPPWDKLLEQHNNGNIFHHGWIDSHTEQYLRIIKGCKFAHMPTYSEGQMGTLLELIFSGCVPITTRASGIDDNVLKHCIVVEPLNIQQQRQAIGEALSWSDAKYYEKRDRLLVAARQWHTWEHFTNRFTSAIRELEIHRRG